MAAIDGYSLYGKYSPPHHSIGRSYGTRAIAHKGLAGLPSEQIAGDTGVRGWGRYSTH
jgi:hypothetical protein